jgi:hypothetical protein
MSDDPNHEHDRTNLILTALTHVMLGGLSSDLEYRAKQHDAAVAEFGKHEYGAAVAGEDGARFEEDDDRP